MFTCQKPCVGIWNKLNDTSEVYDYRFDLVAADGTHVWAANQENGKLFYRDLELLDSWYPLLADVKHISVCDLFAIVVKSMFCMISR